MRELFDQYRYPENRLTHALVCCLAEDPMLMGAVLRWVGVAAPTSGGLRVVEQRLPGEPAYENEEVDAERRGLPDGWIYTDDGWALLIESKVASNIDREQIERHRRTATKRGFSNVHVLVLCVDDKGHKVPEWCTLRRWADLYAWGVAIVAGHFWAGKLIRYMEVAERRMVDETYLQEGTLTTFSGMTFDDDNPYTYLEGKRLLRLLLQTLRTDKSLSRELGADLSAPGRGAITGSQESRVWDFIPLEAAREANAFTSHPHLTLTIQRERVLALVTIPNGLAPKLRRRLLAQGYQGFSDALSKFLAAAQKILRIDSGAKPLVIIQQRHYPSQRSKPIEDARLEFDPRTAFGLTKGIKEQDEWLRATYALIENRRSNLQLAIGMAFRFGESETVKTAAFPQLVAAAWKAAKPFICLLLPERSS